MIAVQMPSSHFSTMPYHRPSHVRHPSAPVVVRPTQTPGLLSLSKPTNNQVPRSQQQTQQYARAPRSSTKSKASKPQSQAPARPQEQPKKLSAPKSKQQADQVLAVVDNQPTLEKLPRGRQANKPAPKEKADRRPLNSSRSRTPARRPSHQPSPPPPVRIPQQTDSATRPPVNPLRAQSFKHRDSDSNLFDPFVVQTSSDSESAEAPAPATAKPSAKTHSFRAPPQLAPRPSGKLARRRQSVHDTTVSPSVSPSNASTTPRRPATRRVSTGPAFPSSVFPICDDSDDVTPPTTPIRESASVPAKRSGATWQQQTLILEDAPRTAPLSSTFQFPFEFKPAVTPTPAQRRRNHRRVPSEGVFSMSMDEDSSNSDASEELKTMMGLINKRRSQPPPQRTPSPEGLPAGFYAGSVYQNSPSPEDLPVPAFAA